MSKQRVRCSFEDVFARRLTLLFFIILVAAYVFTSTFLVAYMKRTSFSMEVKEVILYSTKAKLAHPSTDSSSHASGHNNTSQRNIKYPIAQKIKYPIAQMILDYQMKGLALRKMFNCSLLFKGDANEVDRVTDYLIRHKGHKNVTLIPDFQAVKMFKQCDTFKSIRGYAQTAKTEAEKNFPMAFVILMHEGFEQMERLVRTLYQPQNVFCIHVDLKSPKSLHQAVTAYASCFPNIYMASRQYDVKYAHVTRLLADIACMTDLSKLNHTWRYLITGVSTEFPLRGNKEKVDIFTALKGFNHIREAWSIRIPGRYKKRYKVVNGKMHRTRFDKKPAPHNLTVVKGMAGNAFSRAFVDWFYKDKMAQEFLQWSTDTYSPDEHYWGTLNDLYHNPFLKTPGGYTGHPDSKHYQGTFAIWVSPHPTHTIPCYGRVQHNLCNFGSKDLPVVGEQLTINANKFDLENDPVAYACMEELLEDRERHPRRVKIGIFLDNNTVPLKGGR